MNSPALLQKPLAKAQKNRKHPHESPGMLHEPKVSKWLTILAETGIQLVNKARETQKEGKKNNNHHLVTSEKDYIPINNSSKQMSKYAISVTANKF